MATLAWVPIAGCAHFQVDGSRTVPDGGPRRVGTFADTLLRYNLLEVRRYPTAYSHALQVQLTKVVSDSIRFEQNEHVERIYKRQRSRLEADIPMLGFYAGLFAVVRGPTWRAGVALAGLAYVALENPPPPDTRSERVPDSDLVVVSFRAESLTVPAVGESLVAATQRIATTDANGTATFYMPEAMYDSGFAIYHVRTGTRYAVRRVRQSVTVTVKEDWHGVATALEIGHSAATIAGLVNVWLAEAPPAEVLWVAVEFVGGHLLLHRLFPPYATRTEIQDRWVIFVK